MTAVTRPLIRAYVLARLSTLPIASYACRATRADADEAHSENESDDWRKVRARSRVRRAQAIEVPKAGQLGEETLTRKGCL